MAAMIRVAHADDYEPFRTALRRYFCEEPDMAWAGDAADGAEALALVASKCVDVLMLDLAMPTVSGWEVLDKAPLIAPRTAILVLSSYADLWIRQKTLLKGAKECLPKESEPRAIVDAVRRVARAQT